MPPRPKVVVAEAIAPAGLEALAEHCVVDVAVDADRAELLIRLGDAAGLIVRSATKVDGEMIAAAPQLQVIGRAGIGVDNIDVAAATAAGVLVVNAPQSNIISAAEHTLALLLAQARRIPEADHTMREGKWERKRLEGVELHDKTLGVIGLGRIGTLVAQRASAFGMRIVAYDPYVGHDRARRLGVDLAEELADLAETADFITIHLPLTPETERLIDETMLARMKAGVRIVNTSRGGIVDEDALADAVRAGRVAGAALDVFASEPLNDSPLVGLPQVVLTPHLGASTREAQDKAGLAVAEAVAQALRGELVLSAVNVDMGTVVLDDVTPFLPIAQHLGEMFVAFARGLPESLKVRAEGQVAESPTRPLVLAVLKGALARVSESPVSYVNAAQVAESRGIRVTEESVSLSEGYQSRIRLSGTVGGKPVVMAATHVGRKGPVLVEVNGYDIEMPISRYVLLLRNDDVPGVIGRVGTYLGSQRSNISDMVVGRATDGSAAMMGLNLDQALTDDQVAEIRALDGIADARFIELSGF
jgi:D-3-phosphoglycerate dehydrogenase